ncbi:MAG: cysteine hydrolase [Actinomycetota bacterium]|nr:cysteine hydrolase [Actinomycetota bacterium]
MSGFDPTKYLEPSRCAVVVFECQQMVLGEHVPYRGLADAARNGVLGRLAALLSAARRNGAHVVYCTMSSRDGAWGAPKTPMLDRARATGAASSATIDRSIVPEVAPVDSDVIIDRTHGMSGFHGTELDPCLRAMGVETVLPTGVSANLGVLGTAIEAVNHGYRLVIPSDCIAADPPEYGEQMMRYSYRNLGYLTTSDVVTRVWDDTASHRPD